MSGTACALFSRGVASATGPGGVMIEAVLTAVFVLSLPVWLLIEQILVMMGSTRLVVRQTTRRVAPAVAYQGR